LVLIDPAPVTRAFRAEFEAEFSRRQASADVAGERAALAESDLRVRDPDAYRHRAFELSVAGYFADPSRARDLTPFRVVGRVQQTVWESLGDFDLTAPGYLNTVDAQSIVIHGRQDPIPIASSEAAARAARADLVPIDDCGHVPYVEQPAALFGAIRRFLAANR
jgi:proline iminopeptidase